MSWLFGYRHAQPPQDFPQFVQQPPPAGSSGTGGSDGTQPPKKTTEAYGFDSSSLERAAAAAKELERSKHAKDILELSKMQEKAREKELLAAAEQFKVERERVNAEERRKTLQEETKQHQMRAQYQDQLTRKRYSDQLMQQQRMNEENLRRQEESIARQEAMKRATIEHEMEMLQKNEMKKLEAEVMAKAKIERETQDLNLEKIRLEASENRITVLESIKTAGSVLGTGVSALLSDWNKIYAAAGGLSLVALGVYSAKGGVTVASRYISSRLLKPTLVSETSRFSLTDALRHPVQTVKKFSQKENDPLSGIVLAPQLEKVVRDIAISTKNTQKNRGMYQNILLYGPPGTGKTMFARKLAQYSGMNYAIVTGGDLVPMGRNGVEAIHKVFDWASTSRKGLLLFIDEADAFLKKRSGKQLSEDLNSMLNTFLYRTGTQSNKFMLVLASNTPEQFDWAVHNRLDLMVEFNLPGLEERERLVRLYFEKYVLQPSVGNFRKVKIELFDFGALCSKIAYMTDGMSGRELSKLALFWQTIASTSENGVLTEKMILDATERFIRQHQQTVFWQSREEKEKSKSMSLGEIETSPRIKELPASEQQQSSSIGVA